ncbi:MAG: type VI secretion system baseplate subunit TssE [Chitinivibrionales bacterium]|nr:type VI secretion system baseplate subunit TssE [Chitinivibrionales bacterium]MBD3358477.1 type VI secretion system baseplate subunit TssE [Chitinivibrionales bacterium]
MAQEGYIPTIIDRLCGITEPWAIGEVCESVRSHLECLLNSRQGRDDIPPWFVELSESLATYGIGNIDNVDLEDQEERRELIKSIHRAIALFEPRLDEVSVIDKGIEHPFVLKLEINAVLRLGRSVEPVVFGTTLRKNGTAHVAQT